MPKISFACLLPCLFAFGHLSCVEFNTCDNRSGAVLGSAAVEFDIRKTTVRKQECAIGNLVADSIYWYAAKECQGPKSPQCPDLAFINAGAIREETACGTRKSLSAGLIYQSDIEQLLPFNNNLVVVRLSGHDIKLALEHSVSELGRAANDALASHFLHVSGLSFDVDCHKPPLALSADGTRVSRAGNRVSNIVITSKETTQPLELNQHYYVAMTSFLASGSDGYLAFLQRDQDNHVLLSASRQPLTKFSVQSDAFFVDQKPVPYRQATLEWILALEDKGFSIAPSELGRVYIDENCNFLL
jgi:2',3'-cyclic-nucleotide 2'-phosphodiesterase (5'-nucleotidase family)